MPAQGLVYELFPRGFAAREDVAFGCVDGASDEARFFADGGDEGGVLGYGVAYAFVTA
jgi:hypothetical protein